MSEREYADEEAVAAARMYGKGAYTEPDDNHELSRALGRAILRLRDENAELLNRLHVANDGWEKASAALLHEKDMRDKAEREDNECHELNVRLSNILTRTANALKGEPEPLSSHSWADLPERAGLIVENERRLIAEVTELRAKVERARQALVDYGEHGSDCILSRYEGGQPIEGGGYEQRYAGKWYEIKPVDRTPPCTCGLDAAINAAEGK